MQIKTLYFELGLLHVSYNFKKEGEWYEVSLEKAFSKMYYFIIVKYKHDIKFTILIILKCAIQCIKYISNGVQPSPPSISGTFVIS